MTTPRPKRVRVDEHVKARLMEYQRDKEYMSQTINRLLPFNGEVLGVSDRPSIYLKPAGHNELLGSAGPGWNMSDVLDQYLTEAGYPRNWDDLRYTSPVFRLGAGRV